MIKECADSGGRTRRTYEFDYFFFARTWRVLQTEQMLPVEFRPQTKHSLECDKGPIYEVLNIFEIFVIEL